MKTTTNQRRLHARVGRIARAATLSMFAISAYGSAAAPRRRLPFRSTPGAQRCRADGTWFACEHPECTLQRACSSNRGLRSCACPDPNASRSIASTIVLRAGGALSAELQKNRSLRARERERRRETRHTFAESDKHTRTLKSSAARTNSGPQARVTPPRQWNADRVTSQR